MLSRKGFLLICLLWYSTLSHAQLSAIAILKNSQQFISQHAYLNYHVDFSWLSAGGIDTTHMSFDVKLDRKSGKREAELLDRPYISAFHDSTFESYSINKNRVTYRTEQRRSLPHDFHIGHRFFRDSALYYPKIENDCLIQLAGDTIMNGYECYVIVLQFPDMYIMTDVNSILYINKQDFMLIRKTETGYLQKDPNYHDYRISNYHFEAPVFTTLSDFKGYDIVTDTTTQFHPEKPHKLLNQKVKSVTVRDIKTDQSVPISFTGKVTLIDFSYMGCYGCMLSYPVVDSIHNEWPDVQVIGLNGIDTDIRLKDKLKQYHINHHIHYDSYTLNEKEYDYLFEGAAPLFMIIDKKGILRYTSMGYHQDLHKELIEKIKEVQ